MNTGLSREKTEILETLIDNLNEIKYGSITIIIQDGKIVQIEKNEKIRLR